MLRGMREKKTHKWKAIMNEGKEPFEKRTSIAESIMEESRLEKIRMAKGAES